MRIILILGALLFLAGCETYTATVVPANTRAHIQVGIHSGYYYNPYLYHNRPVIVHRHVYPRYRHDRNRRWDCRRYDRRGKCRRHR